MKFLRHMSHGFHFHVANFHHGCDLEECSFFNMRFASSNLTYILYLSKKLTLGSSVDLQDSILEFYLHAANITRRTKNSDSI
jgi:hypothetical protein